VEDGSEAVIDICDSVTPKDNGKFRNIYMKGWEVTPPGKWNVYDGKNPPW
jgi:hypothetical protein